MLLVRRHSKVSGGELGGPKWLKLSSSAFFFVLWVIFVAFSAMESYDIIQPNI